MILVGCECVIIRPQIMLNTLVENEYLNIQNEQAKRSFNLKSPFFEKGMVGQIFKLLPAKNLAFDWMTELVNQA